MLNGARDEQYMAGQLFRQEALAHQAERHWGSSVALPPVSLSVMTSLLLAVVITAGGFLAAGNYQRKSVVTGILVSSQGTVQVRAPVAGIVEEVATGTGERVGKGELLLRLGTQSQGVDGQAVTGRLLAENRRQEALLTGLLQDREAEYALRQAQLDGERSRLQQRCLQLEGLATNARAVLALLSAQHERLGALVARSVAAVSDLERARMDQLRQQAVVQQAMLDLADTRQALDAKMRDAALLELEHGRGVSELQRSLSELYKQDLRLQAEAGMALPAPLTGTVTDVLIGAGAAVVAGQPLLSLVAMDAELEAELRVPSRAMGFLREGTVVNVRLDAFPHQKFGMQGARIREIATTPVMPAATEGNSGMEPYYRVLATLDAQAIPAQDGSHALRPGMQFQADVVLETRSLLEWLLEPLLARGWPRT